MEVQIPSPSVFLKKSPVLTPAPALPAKRPSVAKAKGSAPVKAPNKPATVVQDGAVAKSKQSKSRNGTLLHESKTLSAAMSLSNHVTDSYLSPSRLYDMQEEATQM